MTVALFQYRPAGVTARPTRRGLGPEDY